MPRYRRVDPTEVDAMEFPGFHSSKFPEFEAWAAERGADSISYVGADLKITYPHGTYRYVTPGHMVVYTQYGEFNTIWKADFDRFYEPSSRQPVASRPPRKVPWRLGPWKIRPIKHGNKAGSFVNIDGPGLDALARVVWRMNEDKYLRRPSPEQEANARLIEAAPTLAELLIEALDSGQLFNLDTARRVEALLHSIITGEEK